MVRGGRGQCLLSSCLRLCTWGNGMSSALSCSASRRIAIRDAVKVSGRIILLLGVVRIQKIYLD